MSKGHRRRASRPVPVAAAATAARTASKRPAAQQFTLNFPSDLIAALTGGGNIAPKISRNEAMQVPAVMRARNLICGSIAKLPLRVLDPDYRPVPPYGQSDGPRPTQYLVNSPPDPEIPQIVTIAQTVEDLLFEGVAFWRVTRFGWHNYPVEARWVPHTSVLVAPSRGVPPSQMILSPDELFPTPDDGGVVYIDGHPVPDNEIIRFDSPLPPLLRHAARAIRTCLMLDQSAALYAGRTIPLGYFGPEDPTDPPDDAEAQQSIDELNAAMQRNAMPWVPGGIKPYPMQWNPEQLQLAAQRQHAVLEIARATGVDADYLESSAESGNSETYANSEDKRQDLIDFTLDPFLTAIQQRLSMRDCLPLGYCADFDTSGFLRGDTQARMTAYATGKPLGAYTTAEIRRAERKPPLTAAELAEIVAKPAPGEPLDQPSAPAAPPDQPPAPAATAEQGVPA